MENVKDRLFEKIYPLWKEEGGKGVLISTIYYTIIETFKQANHKEDSWSASSMRSILVEPITRICFRRPLEASDKN